MVGKVNKNQCPICLSKSVLFLAEVKDIEYQTSLDDYRYYQCKNCDVVYLDEPPVKKLGLIYPEYYYSYLDAKLDKNLFRKIVWNIKEYQDVRLINSLMKRIKKDSIAILDVGGGSGYLLDKLKEKNSSVGKTCIIDFDEKSKVLAESKGHNFIKSTVEQAKVNDKFDLVLALNLIEHVENPNLVLKKLYENGFEQSIVLLKTPNTNSLNFKWFSRSYWGGYHAPRHFVLFNEKNIRRVCEDIGFKDIDIIPTQGAPQWAASIYGFFHFRKIKKKGEFPDKIFAVKIPLYLLVFAAAFDFFFGKFFGSDQMFVVLKK